MAEPLLLAALLDVLALGVAQSDPYATAFGGTLAQEVVEARVRLMQKDRSVDKDVDVLAGLGQHVGERGHRDIGALVV